MKPTSLAAFVTALFAALCAFALAPASAQSRDNVYVVSGVLVDETAANAAAAQEAAFAAAQREGFGRLLRRLTLPAELAAHTMPALEQSALERLVLSVDVEQERRSATRYIGRLAVRFDPSGVRALLRAQNLTVVDTRTAPVLVIAAAEGAEPETAALWSQVWREGGFEGELVPLSAAPDGVPGPPAWSIAQPYAQAVGAASALYATLRVRGQTATATLIEVSGDARRERGEVLARINGDDAGALRAALASLADQASVRVQDEWKSRIAIGGGQRARVSASALYRDERQWENIKQALGGAAETLISEIRIEAVGREGALVSFSFVGDRTQLAAELARRGVGIEDTAQGPVLRVLGR